MNKYFEILILSCLSALLPCGAWAAGKTPEELVLTASQSQMMTFADTPSTIVVGDPSVADVTSQGKTMFLHPRGYGLTNIVVLDVAGKKLGDYLVRVVYEDRDSVAIYAPAGRSTFTCTGDCEPTLRIGDNAVHSGNYSASYGVKNGLTSSVTSGDEATLPPSGTTVTTVSGSDVQIQ